MPNAPANQLKASNCHQTETKSLHVLKLDTVCNLFPRFDEEKNGETVWVLFPNYLLNGYFLFNFRLSEKKWRLFADATACLVLAKQRHVSGVLRSSKM